jgi:hypothetical protein
MMLNFRRCGYMCFAASVTILAGGLLLGYSATSDQFLLDLIESRYFLLYYPIFFA